MWAALKVVGLAMAAFLLWAFLRTPSPDEREQSSQRHAIDQCWSEQKRKSLPPDQARFIAGACEMMEGKYKARWGHNP